MDWEALQQGLGAWFAVASGIEATDLAWAGEPVGHRGYPYADLELHRAAADAGTDEIRYEADALGRLTEYVSGNRIVTLTITVMSRDQHGNTRAWALLDRVRNKLAAGWTLEVFDSLGVAQRDTAPVQHIAASEALREMSVAALSLSLGYTVYEPTGDLAPPIETIEHVVLQGGEVLRALHDPEPIVIADETIPTP